RAANASSPSATDSPAARTWLQCVVGKSHRPWPAAFDDARSSAREWLGRDILSPENPDNTREQQSRSSRERRLPAVVQTEQFARRKRRRQSQGLGSPNPCNQKSS